MYAAGSYRRLLPLLLPTLTLLSLCGSSFASPDAESAKPYKLTVVLRVAEHPLLTPLFKEQLQRELRDGLRDALNPNLVHVEVVSSHPILDEVNQRGLQAALDNFKSADKNAEPIKTHVVLVNYVEGKYEIQAGQLDGLTGLATPVVRKARLEDPAGRQLVARTAALMVQRDFGLVGTVVDGRDPNKVRIALKGGKLGVPLDSWVQKNEVFAVVQVNRLGGSQPVRDAILQVIDPPDKDGVCLCRLYARHAESDNASRLGPGSGVLGYRCLKLGTADAPLRLRLVNDRGLPHSKLQVKVCRVGFETDKTNVVQDSSTNREGYVETSEKISHVAFVVVQNGTAVVARIPIPIWEGNIAVRTLVLDPNSTRIAELIALRDQYVRRLDDSLQLQLDLGKKLVELLGKSQHEDALQRAKKGAVRLNDDLRDLDSQKGDLLLQVTNAKLPDDVSRDLLADGGRRQHLDRAKEQLDEFIKDWSSQLQRKTEQRELAGIIAQARLLKNNEARYDEAIKLYEQAFAKYEKTPELEKEYTDLKAAWELKGSPEFADARRWIFNTWPELNTPEKIAENLDTARKHFEECRKIGDKLGPRKMLLAGLAHTKRIQDQMAGLRVDREEERQKFESLKSVRENLKKLLDDVHAYSSGK